MRTEIEKTTTRLAPGETPEPEAISGHMDIKYTMLQKTGKVFRCPRFIQVDQVKMGEHSQ